MRRRRPVKAEFKDPIQLFLDELSEAYEFCYHEPLLVDWYIDYCGRSDALLVADHIVIHHCVKTDVCIPLWVVAIERRGMTPLEEPITGRQLFHQMQEAVHEVLRLVLVDRLSCFQERRHAQGN